MNYSGIGAIANRALFVPNFKAYDARIVNGYAYVCSVEPEAHEIPQRAEIFEPRIGYVFENWATFFEDWTQECDSLLEEMKQLEFGELVEVEPEAIMPELQKHYPVHKMYSEYLKLWDIMVRMSQQTKKALLPSYGADLVFIENMKKLFPGISDTAITQITQGFESKLFRAIEELQQLAQSAFDLGLSKEINNANTWEEVDAKLQQKEAGLKWLKEFEDRRYPWFEMSTGEGWQKSCIAWNEDLNIPLGHLKDYINALGAGKTINRPKEEVLKCRDTITEEYRKLIKNEEDANAFDNLVGLTRMVAAASEDHSIYQGSWFHNLYDRKLRQIGQLLVNHEIVKDREDVFLLNRQNLDCVVWELYTSWCRGVEPAAKYYWPKRIERRKEILERFQEWTAPPGLGIVPETIESPTTIVLFGITPELVTSWWEASSISEDETTELRGFSGSAGEAEGTARVCRTVGDIATLKTGEILVTPSTAPTWAPTFHIVNGVVTDMGGVFSHTAIVAREYGIPAVVGTGYATSRIKSGDKIKINGDSGIVTILERANQ
jgi:pyruvate,water dikinase